MFLSRRLLKYVPPFRKRPWDPGYFDEKEFMGYPSYQRGIRNLKWTKPVTLEDQGQLFGRLERELRVMRCLATPYLTRQEENAWFERCGGTPEELKQKADEESERLRMPWKPKRMTGQIARYGNVGNLLHSPRTLDQHFEQVTKHTTAYD